MTRCTADFNMKPKCLLLAGALLSAVTGLSAAEPISLTIQADQPGPRINPAMWGIFFEDINLGADGGLYAELVKNRSFEFPGTNGMMGWTRLAPDNSLEILKDNPFDPQNPHYLRITS